MREEQEETVLDRSIGINSSQAFYSSLVNREIPKGLLGTKHVTLRLQGSKGKYFLFAGTFSAATFLFLAYMIGRTMGYTSDRSTGTEPLIHKINQHPKRIRPCGSAEYQRGKVTRRD